MAAESRPPGRARQGEKLDVATADARQKLPASRPVVEDNGVAVALQAPPRRPPPRRASRRGRSAPSQPPSPPPQRRPSNGLIAYLLVKPSPLGLFRKPIGGPPSGEDHGAPKPQPPPRRWGFPPAGPRAPPHLHPLSHGHKHRHSPRRRDRDAHEKRTASGRPAMSLRWIRPSPARPARSYRRPASATAGLMDQDPRRCLYVGGLVALGEQNPHPPAD